MALTLQKTHPVTLTIDDEPVRIHVKRMVKGEAIDFERDFFRYGQPRGSKEATTDESEAAREFVSDSISRFITVEEGDIIDNGHPVTTGEDVIRTFCTRGDVLGAFYRVIYSENFLGKAQKKILSAQPFFFPGSQQSIPRPDGDRPEATAANAEISISASPEDATDVSEPSPTDDPPLSGPKVH